MGAGEQDFADPNRERIDVFLRRSLDLIDLKLVRGLKVHSSLFLSNSISSGVLSLFGLIKSIFDLN